jgi:phosphoribosyl 1,2-cyclic phosphodiesterase
VTSPDSPRLWTLGSGSKGNAALVEWNDRRVLLDAGFDLVELVARLRAVDVAPATIDDVFLTHGHKDHVLGAADGARIYGWRLWGTLGTVWRWRDLRDVPLLPFEPGDTIRADPFVLETAPTIHDVDDSSAVVVRIPDVDVRIGYCTDLGEVTPAVVSLLRGVDALVVEANHDPHMLAVGPYPPRVRVRVAGPTGHLSNEQAAALLREVASPRLRHVVLAHVSRHNNTPALALRAARAALSQVGFAGELTVAPQDTPLGPLLVPSLGTAEPGVRATSRAATAPATFPADDRSRRSDPDDRQR